jgi:hypothetical protein
MASSVLKNPIAESHLAQLMCTSPAHDAESHRNLPEMGGNMLK